MTASLLDFEAHLARLDRSLAEIALAAPLSHDALRALHKELIARNEVNEGIVYLEITRGVADRDFAYPENTAPTVVAFTQSRPLIANPYAETGVKVVTIPDIRWKRRDIKSTAMLAQAMGKQAAKLRGAYEAWMVEDGHVTEGTSSTAFILDADGVVRTQPLGHHILPGVTRRAVLRLAAERGGETRGAAVQRGGGARGARSVHVGGIGLRAADRRDRRHARSAMGDPGRSRAPSARSISTRRARADHALARLSTKFPRKFAARPCNSRASSSVIGVWLSCCIGSSIISTSACSARRCLSLRSNAG